MIDSWFDTFLSIQILNHYLDVYLSDTGCAWWRPLSYSGQHQIAPQIPSQAVDYVRCKGQYQSAPH
jgi:hypothetical protein